MKLALCIGINDYPGVASDLGGCVHDAEDWMHFLEEHGFVVTPLVDEDATYGGVLRELANLRMAAGRGDQVWLTFSGHGTWRPDRDGDEADNRDEMICLHDQDVADDDIDAALLAFQPSVHLSIISDSCHSGGITRSMIADGLPGTGISGVRFRPPNHPAGAIWLPIRRRMWHGARSCEAQASRAVLTGCNALEYSYDATIDGRPNGAFTRTALDAFEDGMTWEAWHREIRQSLPSGQWPQSPQLEGDTIRLHRPVFPS